MKDWQSNLRRLDTAGLKRMDTTGLKQPWDGKLRVKFGDGQTDVAPEKPYRSPALTRKSIDLRPVNSKALEYLAELPGPGEAIHAIIGDTVSLWDMVPALLDKRAPEPIAELWVSTLSFGSITAAEMLALLDSGRIERVHMLVSVMFSAKSKSLFDELIPPLQQRGHRAEAMRVHAKILGIRFAEGDRYVIESSSNLRGCSCAEHLSVINDAGLFDFHAGWIDRALTSATSARSREAKWADEARRRRR